MSADTSSVPEGIALTVDDDLVGVVDFEKADGLVPAIVQDASSIGRSRVRTPPDGAYSFGRFTPR